MRVLVIIVNHQTGALLGRCLSAYDAQDHPVEIVVVDNASTDGSSVTLDAVGRGEWRHPVEVVRNETNRGFSGAVNDVLARRDADAVIFSNVDVEPRPDLVSKAVAALVDEACGTVQPKLLRFDAERNVIDTTGHVIDRARLVANRGEGEDDDGRHPAGEIFGASGAVVLHRRAMLEDVAWASGEVLTEDLFAFFEDVELDWRARRHGWSAVYVPDAVALHQRGGVGPRRSRHVEALNWSNRLLVIVTCDDLRDVATSLPLILATTLAKSLELAVTSPRALVSGVARLLRHLPGALRRRRELDERSRREAAEVVTRWVVPFDVRRWVGTWRRRRLSRAPRR